MAKDWEDKKNTIWTEGSKLENGRVGAVAVWWPEEETEEETPLLWIGPVTGRRYNVGTGVAGWTGRRVRLDENKEVFDAELFALYRASKVFNNRNERGQHYASYRTRRRRSRVPGLMKLALDKDSRCNPSGVQPPDQPGKYPDLKMGTSHLGVGVMKLPMTRQERGGEWDGLRREGPTLPS